MALGRGSVCSLCTLSRCVGMVQCSLVLQPPADTTQYTHAEDATPLSGLSQAWSLGSQSWLFFFFPCLQFPLFEVYALSIGGVLRARRRLFRDAFEAYLALLECVGKKGMTPLLRRMSGRSSPSQAKPSSEQIRRSTTQCEMQK